MDQTNPVFVGLLLACGALGVLAMAFGGWTMLGGPIPSRALRGFGSPVDLGLYCLHGGLSVLLLGLSMAAVNLDEIPLALILMISAGLIYFFGWRRHRPRLNPESVPRGWRHPLVLTVVIIAAVVGVGVLVAVAGYQNWW